MSQAQTLCEEGVEKLLTHLGFRKHEARNRAMMLLTHWAGMKIGEVASLRWSDVMRNDGTVIAEIRILPEMTKGRHARTVFMNSCSTPGN